MYYSLKYSASTFVYSFCMVNHDNPSGNLYAKLYRL